MLKHLTILNNFFCYELRKEIKIIIVKDKTFHAKSINKIIEI